MNPVLESTHAKLLHFLAWGQHLPSYLANKEYRLVQVGSRDKATLYHRRILVGWCTAGKGLLVPLSLISDPVGAVARSNLIHAAPAVFGIELPEEPELSLDPVGVTLLGWLGVLSYRATWRTRLKHQKVRQPW